MYVYVYIYIYIYTHTHTHTLQLPDYPHTSTLREKLLYAINSASGFELS